MPRIAYSQAFMNPGFFLSCDWGTTHFRLRLVNAGDGDVRDELKTDDGVARMAAECRDASREEYFAQVLASRIGVLLERNDVNVNHCVVSGMAGSRLGWRELPYAALPQPLDASGLMTESIRLPIKDRGVFEIILVSGARDDANVMRGEETEIIGLAKSLPFIADEAVVTLIMPGTHSKHVRLSKGMITGFETVMTGELFSHLSTMPTLRDSILPAATFDETHPWFSRGLHEAATPGFFKSLFKIRARNLLDGISPADGAACLSGLLIGTELLQVSAGPGSRVVIASSGSLRAFYQKAVAELKLPDMELIDGGLVQRATVDGHLRILNLRR